MALFSRRPKAAAEHTDAAVEPQAEDAAAPGEPTPEAQDEDRAAASPTDAIGEADSSSPAALPAEPPDAEAPVDISVSSFRGLGAATPPIRQPRVAAEAPPATETMSGLRDNVLVAQALAKLADPPTPAAILNVARQLLQGQLFLRVKGDARSLLSSGRELPLAVANVGDRSFVLAFSSGAALQANVRSDGDFDTSAMGQPILTIIRHVLAGPYQGLVIDQSSAPARAILPRELLEQIVAKVDDSLTVKSLLAEERTPATASAVAQALTRVPLWVAVGGPAGERPGIAEGRSSDGSRYLEVYSHPLEVAAMGRADQPAPLNSAQLAGALRSDEGLTGVVVDPAGPWIRLSRAELAPLLSLAP